MRRSSLIKIVFFALACLALLLVLAGGSSAATGSQDVIGYLNQSITWYRQLPVQQQLANDASDLLFLNDNRQVADQVVRLSFEFARAQAALLSKQGADQVQSAQDGSTFRYNSLLQRASKSEQQVKQTQEEIATLKQKLPSASGRQREALQSAIAETESELQLATTRRDAMRNMVEFVTEANGNGGTGGLQSEIEELARTVPAASAKAQPATASASSAVSTAAPPAPSGILALATDLISLSRKARSLDQAIRSTDTLMTSLKSVRTPLGMGMRDLARRGDELANQPESTDPAILKQQKAQLDALTAQFKEQSEAILPLVKQQILLDQYKRSLTTWRNAAKSQYAAELRGLLVRLVVLAVVLALIVGTAELWRRALLRYVQEVRRRNQLLLIRRIVLWFVIAVVVAFAFSTELGSLATFAGLLTAGVAVALQNVILSIAAYFFLIGKYGIRVGDRVQISGITGEVVDIGLVRLHLMELSAGGADAQPTGRVVVFSNSVVFQPNGGFFKQIPGTNFIWREITLTLAPDADYCSVEERLVGAVEAVFAEYRDQMERQRRHLEKTLGSVCVTPLSPQSRLRLTQSGLQVVIRYPVELENAAIIDDRVARGLLDAIEREPKLKLVGTGVPNIQPITSELAKSQM